MNKITLTHTQQLALEKLQGIIEEMKEVGLELYQEYAPTLLQAGATEAELDALKNDIYLFATRMKSVDALNKKLRSSAVTITRIETMEILYKQEQVHQARSIEQELRSQGYVPHPSVEDQDLIQKDIYRARLRKIVGSDVA